MRTNIKGDIGELLVMTKLLKENYWVSKPFGDDCPYDIICDDKNGNLKRIQVKYVTPINNLIRCKLFSETGVSYKTTVDWIMVVDSKSEKIYKLNLSDFKDDDTVIYLRIEKPKNNQIKNINLAENFIF
jgi:hypothetical protein